MQAGILTPELWAEAQFDQAELGDQRRTRRAVKVAAQMVRRPGDSIPGQAATWPATKASYRLFDQEEVTFEALNQGHWRAVRQEAACRPVVLMIEDTTKLDFTGHPATADLGPIGDGGGRGLMLHSTLAVDPAGAGDVLGLAYQMLFCREEAPPDETRIQRRHRLREFRIWVQSVRAIGESPAGSRWIHVCDRGADGFELFDACRQTHVDCVIRLAQDRRCAPGHEAATPCEGLMHWARTLPACGQQTVQLRRRPQRSPREACLSVAYSAVTLFPPWLDRSKGEPWPGWVVRVWEPATPAGEEPIEWVLLSSVPVDSSEQAMRISSWYALRWLVEEYHKCLKSGCKVESRQMETRARLEACIGILVVVAVRLLQLKLQARNAPGRPAIQCASPLHVQVLAAHWKKSPESMTAREFCRDVARLGGFLARKHDGDPGWQTLWRGWLRLQDMTAGAALATPGGWNCG
jgi:hypothetical protein